MDKTVSTGVVSSPLYAALLLLDSIGVYSRDKASLLLIEREMHCSMRRAIDRDKESRSRNIDLTLLDLDLHQRCSCGFLCEGDGMALTYRTLTLQVSQTCPRRCTRQTACSYKHRCQLDEARMTETIKSRSNLLLFHPNLLEPHGQTIQDGNVVSEEACC